MQLKRGQFRFRAHVRRAAACGILISAAGFQPNSVAQTRISTLFHAWNWKSALLSAAFRAPIFIVTGFQSGFRSVLGAVLAESVFRIVVSGFYGAIAQRMTRVKERWKAILAMIFVLPIAEQIIDFVIHKLRGTPHLKSAMIISAIVMALSAMFNWYAMTHGALLTDSGKSFQEDVKQLPGIALRFIASGPLTIWRHLRGVI